MQYRELGRTGIRVSELSFGSSPLGGSFGPLEESLGIRAVHAALDQGINLFDSSPLYGGTLAESVLGRALNRIPRDRYVLCTKAGRYAGGEFDYSPARIERSLDESLGRLGTDYVDILLLHDVEFVPLGPIIAESIPMLCRLQRQGKARAIGISGYPLKVFTKVLSQTDLDVVLSYCHFSLNDTTLETLAPLVRENGCGLISAAPLSMGLLTDSGPPEWHPAPPELKEACRRAADHCRARGADLATLGMQFALARTPADTTLTGMATPTEAARNLQSLSTPPDSALLQEVRQILHAVKDLPWPSGLPENN